MESALAEARIGNAPIAPCQNAGVISTHTHRADRNLLMALAFRISSLSAIVALIVTVPFLMFLGEADTALYTSLMVALSLWAHRENIARLRAGNEPKIGS